jgi:hypothetical protein
MEGQVPECCTYERSIRIRIFTVASRDDVLTTMAICLGTKYSSNSQLGTGEAWSDEYHMATSPIHCNTVHPTDGLHNSSQLMCCSSTSLLHVTLSQYRTVSEAPFTQLPPTRAFQPFKLPRFFHPLIPDYAL